MPRKPPNSAILLFDLLFLAYSVGAIHHLTQKPGLPPEWASRLPLAVNGAYVATGDDLEFAASAHSVGDVVTVGSPGAEAVQVRLVQYYGPFDLAIDLLIALIIGGLGLAVHLYQPRERAATLFHLASLTTAAALIGTKTIYAAGDPWPGDFLCALFFLAYTFVGALFVHFALTFPRTPVPNPARIMKWVYLLTAATASVSLWSYLGAAHAHSVDRFRQLAPVTMLQNGVVFLLFLAAILIFVFSYRKAGSAAEGRKLRWILYGLLIGPSPFLLLWVLPEALGAAPVIPEWLFKLTLIVIPLTFAASILRFRVMDIDLLINRSAVYGLVVGFGAVCYVGILSAAARVITSYTREASVVVSTTAAAMLALLFDPARRRVQHFVDRRFFRVQYNFREAQRAFIAELKECLDAGQIARLLVGRTSAILPVQRIGYFALKQPGNRIHLVAHEGFELLAERGVRFDIEHLRSGLRGPVARVDQVEPGVAFEGADEPVFRRWGMALVFPMQSEESRELLGFLVLGEKKSGMRFTAEDVDLLGSVTAQAALSLQRISLQQALVQEHAEAERLEELNRLKSYFVSSVSHDLKTPLTSIRMFAELLRTGAGIPPERTREYLEIIEGESERLTRLINNVLDFARIERGVKEYTFAETDVNELVERTLFSLQYQLRMERFSVHTRLCGELCLVRGDADALTEAIINLLSNAMKYSGGCREIAVATSRDGGRAIIRIADRGIGIAASELPHIFEPFFRSEAGKLHGAGGAGLGLAVVRHIVDAHAGTIAVESKPGEGTAVTIRLPLIDDGGGAAPANHDEEPPA